MLEWLNVSTDCVGRILTGPSLGMVWGPERGGDQCQAFFRETVVSDFATAGDSTPLRLHATWLSQGCETRSGPEYVIRKYTFYENDTFLLLRHHYAEESCSVATHTVTARGVLRLLSASILTPGATEARFQLDTVHVIPLNRQVAHKLGLRVNSTCGPQPKWRPYVPQLVYEQPHHRVPNPLWEGPRYNSLHGHQPSQNRRGIDCLETLGLEFGELRLLRVQKRPSVSKTTHYKPVGRPRVELLLGGLPPTTQTRFTHRPTALQSTALLRSDTTTGCPMCNAISRGTETSPPVLHEVAALPALLGGSWTSKSCESEEGGLWVRRQFRVWPGDKLWTGQWDYFRDPKCSSFLYAVTAAGSYVQRAGRQRRHEELESEAPQFAMDGDRLEDRARREVVPWMTPELAKNIWDIYAPKREQVSADEMLPSMDEIQEAITRSPDAPKVPESEAHLSKRSLVDEDDSYRHLLQDAHPSLALSFAAMLRGNQRYEETTPSVFVTPTPPTPTGTTELDLHVAESILVPGDPGVAARCGGRGRLATWPPDCIPRSLEAPAILGLRARVGVTWSGEYTLLFGPRDSSLWNAPLYQCGPTSSHNSGLRAHLRTIVGLKYGLFSPSSAITHNQPGTVLLFLLLSFLRAMLRLLT
ncbi:uncharacterized protein LOC124299611 [Neodiprion virginianus]|uniref:uncharacterized protein LOC124299611 n=1 Tax=Neodiprion virginianus TaxID=2961670 RepID=UPI001EE72C6B|nr:uncharacterized protein LOC124299611 [Neodiprion virginianus]